MYQTDSTFYVIRRFWIKTQITAHTFSEYQDGEAGEKIANFGHLSWYSHFEGT